MDENDQRSLLDLPTAPLRSILLCLWQDARDVAVFSTCCRGLASLCHDQLMWRELLIRRYGEAVLPGMKPPPEQVGPADVEGYVFYQGLDASEDLDNQHPDKSKQQLAEHTTAAGAEAFTTGGKVISVLAPQQQWRHSSFRPCEGMYVRQAVVQYRELQEPQHTADLAGDWPPNVLGWVYFPSCNSPGFFLREASDSLSRFKTLQELLEAASQQRGTVAVTTAGEIKSKLRPQACWQVQPEYDVGMFVKAEVVQQMGLVPNPPVPDYRRLCASLQRLRLDAAHMTCAWLDDRYLQLEASDSSPADSGMALVLNHVWWLDINGSIPGVPPGRYEVVWVVDVTDARLDSSTTINMSAEAHATHRSHQATEAAAAGAVVEPVPANAVNSEDGASSSSGNHSSAGASAAAPAESNKVAVQMRPQDVERLAGQCRRQLGSGRWGVLSGGLLHVTNLSTVQLRFWSTDSTLKMRVRWAFAELIPVKSEGQQRPQSTRVWRPAGAHTAAASAAPGAGGGGNGTPTGLMSWLSNLFGQE